MENGLTYKIKNNNGLEKFLENDKKVLTFKAIWREDDQDEQPSNFLFCYYLSDDKVEIKEIYEKNSGKSNFPQFLRRIRLPKKHSIDYCP